MWTFAGDFEPELERVIDVACKIGDVVLRVFGRDGRIGELVDRSFWEVVFFRETRFVVDLRAQAEFGQQVDPFER